MATTPLILPLGDTGLLVRFAVTLDDEANQNAVAFARRLMADPPAGVVEIVPNLISVHLRYDPARIGFADLAGEVRLRLSLGETRIATGSEPKMVDVRYGGAEGPDLLEAAAASGLSPTSFIEKHSTLPLRVLAIGFAPGFAYCGFHKDLPSLPRRGAVRPRVPEGTILYAAGQTALTATPIPTGWHVIGRTEFRNFDVAATPPLSLRAGDTVRFVPR